MKKELTLIAPIILMFSMYSGAPEARAVTTDSSNATQEITQPEITPVPPLNTVEAPLIIEAPTDATITEITETEPVTVPTAAPVAEETLAPANVPEPNNAEITITEPVTDPTTAPVAEETQVPEIITEPVIATTDIPVPAASEESSPAPTESVQETNDVAITDELEGANITEAPQAIETPIDTTTPDSPAVAAQADVTETIVAETTPTPEATPSDETISAAATAVAEATTASSTYVSQVNTNQKVVSLTISGATNETYVDAILANLSTLGIKATFFFDGYSDPALIAKIAAAGHEIGNQAYTNADATQQNPDVLAADIAKMEEIIQGATGSATEYFRAPFGAYNTSVMDTVGSLGYGYTIGWTVDTQDWTGTRSAAQISTTVINSLSPGAIYLMHANDAASTTAAALLQMVSKIQSLGYQLATISQLLGYEGIFIDVQPDPDPVIDPDPVPDPDPVIDETADPSVMINKVSTDQKVVSLTISGVTNDSYVDAILANLSSMGIKATFFFDGYSDAALIAKIAAAGHEIGNQAYTNADATQQNPDVLAADIAKMEGIIQSATGSATEYFRAPFGAYNASVMETVGSLGYEYTIGWTVDTQDWTGTRSAAEISSTVINSLTPGAIYLMHANEAASTTPEALLQIISQLQSRGYQLATISQLLTYQGVYTGIPDIDENADPSVVVNKVSTDQKVISLTISDITNESNVDAILANLDYLGIKATFFVDGTADQALIAKIAAAGHEIGNQAYTHTDVTQLTADALAADVAKMEAIIKSSTGSSADYFRAPYGIYDTSVLETIGSLGYDYTIGWSIDTQDWTGTRTAAEIANTVISGLAPGSIVLMHANDAASTTPAALLDFVYQARTLGYDILTIADLLGYAGSYEQYTGTSKVVYSVNTDQKVIALTFDDGDSAQNLAGILDNLVSLGITATFFMDGYTDPYLLQRIVYEGHQLANHTYSHYDMTTLSEDEIAYQLGTMDDLVQDYTGTSTIPYYRPPYGYYDDYTLEVTGNLGYEYAVMWTRDSYDYTGAYDASQLSYAFMDHLEPGYIYLFHANVGLESTAEAMWYYVPQALAAGYTFVSVEQLLAFEGVYGSIDVPAYLASLDNGGSAPQEYVEEEYVEEDYWYDSAQLLYQVDTNANVIALTFDDGHADGNLSEILSVLDYYGVQATFFMNGDADAGLLAQIVDSGHQLANHGYSHYDSAAVSAETLAYDIELMEEYIQDLTGTSSYLFFRLPYGSYTSQALETIGNTGYEYAVQWSIDTEDWTGISATAISNAVVYDAYPGAIVLMHASVGAANTPESLWYTIPSLLNSGYELVTVEELLKYDGVYI